MRKLYAVFLIPLLAGAVFARSLNIDPNQSGSILCTSATQNPTQIFLNDPAATRTWIVNTSTNNVFIVGYSTTSALSISSAAIVSTNLGTGSFFIAAATSTFANGSVLPVTFTPDGPSDAYTGPMWCTGGGNGAFVQRLRTH